MVTVKQDLVDRVQTAIETFRDNATPGAQLDFRELAVSIVQVFRDYIGDEIKKPDVRDNERSSKGRE